MRKNLLSALLPAAKNNLLKTLFLGMAFLLYGQVWGQTPNGYLDFGNTANGTTATTGNTSFNQVRVGSGGGSFTIQNAGQSIGNQGEIRGIAPSTGSINSIDVTSTSFGTAAQTFTISFEIYFSGGSSGTWYFFAGNGASFGSTSGFTSAQIFTGLQFVYGASNAIATNNRAGGGWSSSLSGPPFAQNTAYYVTIVGNNSASTVNYGASNAYSVAANKFDLWINGTLSAACDDLGKGALPATTNINAFRFYSESSTSNVATIALDNIRWYNSCVLPPTHLTLVSVPATGTTATNITSYTSEARSGSTTGPVANSFTGAITVGQVSGPGSISGTLAPNAVAGVGTYSDTQFSSAGTYTISSTAAAPIVSSATSGNIVISSTTPSVNLSINTSTGSEASSSFVTLTATASSAVTGAQTVDMALTGTGLTNGDFRQDADGPGPGAPIVITFPYTLTIANGQTTSSVQLVVIDDATYECSETATFTISNPSAGVTIGSTASQNFTITDNDFPTANLSTNTTTGSETSTTSVTLTATSSAAVIGAQTLDVSLSGTGVTNSDFSVTFPRTITIADGATTGTTTFTVADDVIYEGAETATFTMAATSSCIANGATLTQNLTITDNDLPNVNLSINTATGTEAGTTSITLTATSSVAVSGAQTVDVALTGTGVTNSDFSINFPQTITIANGATTGTVTFTVADDAGYECDEAATFTISNPSAGISLGTTSTQNLSITDNDQPTINLSINTATGTETGTTSVTLTATASAAVSGAQTINIGLTGTGVTSGDFSSVPTTITIANGATTGSTTAFTIADDASTEGTETATFTITGFTGSCLQNGSTLSQNLTITDNDYVVNLSVNTTTGTEAASTSITLTATASATVIGNQTVNVALTGTAIAADFSSVPSTITILNGATTGTATFTIFDDAVINEGTETGTFTISSPTTGIRLGSTLSVNVSITDNDISVITTSGTLSSFTANVGFPSTAQSFTVSGDYLSGNLTINALSGYEYSFSSGSGYASSLTVPVSGGNVTGEALPIYVRLTGVSTGTFNGNIAISGGSATTVNVAATGTVIDPNAAVDLFISEYGEGSSGTSKYIEIYNKTGAAVNLANYRIELITNGGSWYEGLVNGGALSGTLANNSVYVIANNSTDVPTGVNLYTTTVNWNGDDAVALAKFDGSIWTEIDLVGDAGADPGTGWAVAGIANATADSRLVRKSSVCGPNANWSASAGTNTTNSEWLVAAYTTGAPSTLGSHVGCSTIPYVELSINTITGTEAGTTAIILTATASGIVTGDQTINVDLTGTGLTNGDFSGATFQATITILNGATTGTLNFNVNDDATINEGTETATFTISNPSSGIYLGTTLAKSLTITDNDVTSLTTGAVSTSPFCVSATGTATGSVAFTSVGTYTSNTFTAQLSDASGAFGSPQNIGTLSLNGVNPSGNISLTIPANISGAGYKIQVVSNSPAFTGTASTAFTVNLGPANVTSQSASTANAQSLVGWINPTICFDDIMVVAKASAFTGAIPSGNGYTCNNSGSFTDGANPLFDGGRIVYKGSSTFQTVTNLTNGTPYNFKIFSRKNNDWSAGVTTSATPNVVNYASFDNFNRTDNLTVGIPSSGGSTAWSEINTGSDTYRAQVESNILRLTSVNASNAAVQGKEQVNFDLSSYYNTTFSTASGKLEWYFNMRSQILGNPSGFGSANYGVAVILGCDQSDFTNASAKGYAVVIGDAASDPVKLVSFSGGITVNSNLTDVALSTQTGLTRYYSVKVTFNPCTNDWALFVNDDGATAFSDPTSVSYGTPVTANVNTHTALNLKYFGALLSHGNSTAGTPGLYVDNISIPITTNGIYTWNASTTDYQVPTAWTPTRSCPQPTDVLQFNNGIPNTVTNVPTQTIARLNVSVSGTIVNLQAAAASNILTLQGGTGTDLDVASGTQLNINGTNDFTIQLATGATGSISGNMTFSNGTHKLKSVDNQSLTFNSGAIFTAGTGFGGNAFGASIVNQPQIVFASGSRYVYQSGGNPFGSAQPNSVLVFQSGSLYKHNSNSGLPSFAGRTYANFEFDFTGAALSSISGSASTCTIGGNMTYTNGTHNFLHQQPINITGNLNITSGNSFNYSPAVASTFNFNGGSAQTIGGGGSITFGANATLQISNNTSLTSTVNVFGIASVTAGTLTSSGNLVIENNANLLHGVGTTLGGGAVSGNIVVKRNGTTSSSVYNYWSTPIASASLGLLGGTNYLYNPANGTADFTDDNPGPDPGWAAASGSFSVGKGYAGQGPNSTVTFTGTANNGTQTAAIQYFPLVNGSSSPGVPYNLIGNIYPSNIDAASFLTANNTKVTGAIYYWDDDNTGGTGYAANDYAIWNGTGSTGGGGRTPNGMIATAQGFFVQALSGATSVSFTNAMRASTATTFFKTEEVIPQRLWLRADNGQHTNQILVGYVDGATQDMDWFYDAQKLRGNHSVSFYSLLNDTMLLGIQGLTPLNGADPAPVPLGLYAGVDGQYSIYIDSIENFPSNLPINMLDADMGVVYDLRNGPYVFQTAQGEDNDRFVLFPNEIVTDLDELDNLHMNIYPNPNNGSFTVMVNSGIEQQVKVSLFDVTGKLVLAADKAISSGNNFIALETQVAGVYMLKIETADKAYNKRVVVY